MSQPQPHLLFLFRSGPVASSSISAGFDLLLTAASFEQKTTAVFLGDGLYNLLAVEAETTAVKNPARALGAFELYGVKSVLALQEDLEQQKITLDELNITVQNISLDALRKLIQEASQVLVY